MTLYICLSISFLSLWLQTIMGNAIENDASCTPVNESDEEHEEG
jgi:hypothetical protein